MHVSASKFLHTCSDEFYAIEYMHTELSYGPRHSKTVGYLRRNKAHRSWESTPWSLRKYLVPFCVNK